MLVLLSCATLQVFTDSSLRYLKTNLCSSLAIYRRLSLNIAGKHLNLFVNIGDTDAAARP